MTSVFKIRECSIHIGYGLVSLAACREFEKCPCTLVGTCELPEGSVVGMVSILDQLATGSLGPVWRVGKQTFRVYAH